MKKRIVVIASLLLVAVIVLSFFISSVVRVPNGEMTAVFIDVGININTVLSDEDAEIVKNMFDGKFMFWDSPSCSFSETVAIVAGGNTYCIACDLCAIIYVAEADKYFHLSEEENEILRSLLAKYGFEFPWI